MVSSSVRELTARCPSSINLQAFRIPMLPKAVIYCWGTAELIDRFCSLRDMNKVGSKMKVRIDYGKVFLKVSLTKTGEYCNDFESRQSSLWGSALKLSGAKRTILLAVWRAPEKHFYIQVIMIPHSLAI